MASSSHAAEDVLLKIAADDAAARKAAQEEEELKQKKQVQPPVTKKAKKKAAKETKKNKKKKKKKKGKKKKAPAAKARKIRLYPSKEEKATLERWIGTARWTYNECLNAVENEGVPRKKKALRARALNEEAIVRMDKPWLRETPYDVRDEAMNDLLKAYKSGFARRANDAKNFKLHPRSRKHAFQESIVVHAKHWKKTRGAYAFLREMKSAEPLPEDLVYDLRLVYHHRTGRFYLCVLSPLPPVAVPRDENQVPLAISDSRSSSSSRIISLDPGVRTFMTGYDPSGRVIEWGRGDIGRIYRLAHALDDLVSRAAKDPTVGHHRRWRMRRAMARMRDKIRNLVYDLHHKLAKFLCEQFDVILLPEFQTQGMIRRGQRRLRRKSVRAMVTWSHYRFRQRLVDKVREYPGRRVILVDEAYTSKTCGMCGALHATLAGQKRFKCPACRSVDCDRDVHAARNILLRYLSDVPFERSVALGPTPAGASSLVEEMSDA